MVEYGAEQCQSLAGGCVDAHVTALLLAAVAPAALEVSLAAAEQVEAQRAQVDQIWRQRLERAHYAADRVRRQYQLAEPENRLAVLLLPNHPRPLDAAADVPGLPDVDPPPRCPLVSPRYDLHRSLSGAHHATRGGRGGLGRQERWDVAR